MGLIASLPEIDRQPDSVFVMHEKSEKLIPLHAHTKGQLSYVEGGIAYIRVGSSNYVVPARHFFWIPRGVMHELKLGHFAAVLRSLYFYASDDAQDPFYSRLGIYPASELLIQMISYTERWDGGHVNRKHPDFIFLAALKRMLPQQNLQPLLISLPLTDDERIQKILRFMEGNMGQALTLGQVSARFGMSERSLSRLFQSVLHISFLQYLKTLRMVKAFEMILKSKKSIGEISFALGYGNIASFSNAFHKFTGSWPTDFRRI